MCWPQRSSTGSFCGLRYNPIRIQRLFLPTFSGAAEKVGLRSNGYGVAVKMAIPVNPDKRADVGIGPYKRLQKNEQGGQSRLPYKTQQMSTVGRVFPK